MYNTYSIGLNGNLGKRLYSAVDYYHSLCYVICTMLDVYHTGLSDNSASVAVPSVVLPIMT